MALRLAELDDIPARDPTSPEAIPKRAAVLATDLVEQARITTLEKLGEDRQAAEIATIWLRTRGASPRPPAGEEPTR